MALAFEASSAGGIPVIKTLREALPGNSDLAALRHPQRHLQLHPLPHGARRLTFEACLAEAQRLGYAEADPTFDVEGFDTAHKLAILTSLAFGTEIDAEAVYVEGISKITPLDLAMAKELGYRIKLLGVAERTGTGIEQRVHPTMVPRTSAIAQVMGVTNAVTIDADAVKELTLIGPGAGGDATASAVVADIADVAPGKAPAPFGRPVDGSNGRPRADAAARGRLLHPPHGARPAGCRGGRGDPDGRSRHLPRKHPPEASESAATKDPHGRSGAPVPLVLITYAATEAAIRSVDGQDRRRWSCRRTAPSHPNRARIDEERTRTTIQQGDPRPCRRASPFNPVKSSSAS